MVAFTDSQDDKVQHPTFSPARIRWRAQPIEVGKKLANRITVMMSAIALLADGTGAEMCVPFQGRTRLLACDNRITGGCEALELFHVGPVERNLGHAVAFIRVTMSAGQANRWSHGRPLCVSSVK